MRKNFSKFILILLILIVVFSFVGCKKEAAKEETVPTAITLPEGEYDQYLVLTTSLMKYADDKKTLEVDVFAIGEDKEMTVQIDEGGIIPRVGRSYRIYVDKETKKAKFAAPDTQSGSYAADFTPKPIAGRDGKYLYDGSGSKYEITKDTVFYYVEMLDNGIHVSKADTLTGFADWNGNCKGEAEDKTHVHTNGCMVYNAYLHYRSIFAKDSTLDWVMISVDGQTLFKNIGKETDSSLAVLPGQNPDQDDIVVTTTEPYLSGGSLQIGVQDLTGKSYVITLSEDSIYPTGGRIYRLVNKDGVYTLKAGSEDGDGYDFRNGAITAKTTSDVTINTDKKINLTDNTQIIEARRLWTGWLRISNVDGSQLGIGKSTNSCKEQGAHEHTRKCFYYNSVYKTDGVNNLTWIMNTGNGDSIFDNIGSDKSKPYGSGSPSKVVIVKSIAENLVTVMDMNGKTSTVTRDASGLEVQTGKIYHMDKVNGKGLFSICERSYKAQDYDLIANPLLNINGKTLTFNMGENAKEAYITNSTKIWYATYTDGRLVLKDSGKMSVANKTNGCKENGTHTHDSSCYLTNALFACDGQANIKWMIVTETGNSLFGGVAANDKTVDSGAASKVFWTTSYPILDGGKVSIKGITMDGKTHTYVIDESGIMPTKGGIYHIASVSNGKAKLSMPNTTMSGSGYDFVRRPIAKYASATSSEKSQGVTGHITIPSGLKYSITKDTKIINVEIIGGIPCLTNTKNINASKLSDADKCIVKKAHTHGSESDCYNWNTYYALGENDSVSWILTAPSDVSIFRRVGIDAFTSFDSKSPDTVALVSKTYPDWDKDGNRTNVAEYVDMTGATKTMTIGEDSLIPLVGKYYNVTASAGKATFSLIPEKEAPSKLDKDGYSMCRHQLIDFDKQSGYGLTRAGQMFRVTSKSKLFNGDYTDGELSVKSTDELNLSVRTEVCSGENHNHTADCFFWGLVFATDSDGNLKWATTKDTGKNNSIWGSLATSEDKAVEETGLLITTSKIYIKDRKNVVDAENIAGTKYVALEIADDSIIPQKGFGYWTSIDGSKATFKSGATGAYRDKAISYSKGILDANSFDYKVSATTIIRYVSLKNKQLSFTTGSGIPAAVGGSNLWVGVKDNEKLNAKFVVVEANGNGLYSYIGVPCSHNKEEIVDKEADCTNDGIKHYYCSKCGYTWPQETIKATGHSWKWIVDQAATCNALGKKHEQCENCTAVQSENTEIAKLEHSFTNYVSNNDATCTADGTKTAQCDHGCGATDVIADPESALGHDYVPTVVDGVTAYTCSRCGDSYSVVGADKYALTLSHTYPEWDGGVKTNKVKVMTMKGEEKIVTVDQTNGDTPIKGKLYEIAVNESNLAIFTEPTVNGADAKTSVQIKDFTAYTKDSSVTAGSAIALAQGAYNAAVDIDSNNRLSTVETEPTSGKCMYTLGKDGKLAWLLVSQKDISNGIYSKASAETDMEPAERAGYALVKEIKINAAGNAYQVTYYDFAMEGAEETKTLSGGFCPKASYAYAYKLNEDGTVTFSKMSGSDNLQRDQVKTPYEEGILTGANSKKISYKVCSDTKIFYAKATAGTSTAAGTLVYDSEYAGGLVPNSSKYTYWIMRDENNFAKWIVMNTDNTSSYYSFGDEGYGEQNASFLPGKLALVNTNVWVDSDGSYKADITTMSGENKTVKVDTESTDGVVPIRGSFYKIEEGENGVTFAWTSIVNYGSFNPQGTDKELVRGQVKSIDKDASKLIVWDKNKANTELPLSGDVNIVIAKRESSSVAVLDKECALEDVKYPGETNANYNAYFGFDSTGKVSWVLVSSGTSSIYSIGDVKTEPKLPTGYVITTQKISQQDGKWILSFQDINGAKWTDVTMDKEYTGQYIKDYYGGLFKFSYNSETSQVSLTKTGVGLGKMQSFTDTQFVVKDGKGDHTINYTSDTPILAVRKDGLQTSPTYACINVTGTNLTVQANTYNTWYLADGDNCKWVVCGTSAGSIYNYANSEPMIN